jgi:hypothetical protein
MMKLSKKEIDFCGKPRKFKRVSDRVLKDASKELEEIQEEMTGIVRDLKERESEAQKKRVEANEILMKPKPTKAAEAKAKKLLKEADKIVENLENSAKVLEKRTDELNDKLLHSYGVIAETLLDPMTVDEFINEHDNLDMIRVTNLSILYDLYMADFPEAKIEQRFKQMIDAEHDQSFPGQNGETRR